MKQLLMATVLLFFGIAATAQSNAEKQVAQAVQQLTRAMIDADAATLGKLTSPLLSYGHSSAHIETKKEFIDNIVSGKSDFVTIDLTDQTIVVDGKTAIVRHVLNASTNDSGKPGTVKLHILTVWQKKGGNWILLARQAVKVP